MKASVIVTVYNEENTITRFLESVNKQTEVPDEVVIVDGSSKDSTVKKINEFINRHKKLNIRLVVKAGNRSVGRNTAIKNARNEIIAISDSGNILDRDWLKNIVKPFKNKKTDVVAGYYKGEAKNIFQRCLIPYVLVMPDKVNKDNFLPATRSMAIKKSVWKRSGGFNEKLSHNEDYEFANRLKAKGANIVFEQTAIANWIPRQNLKQAFIMFFRFALGDIEAGIYREKVVYKFLTYLFAFYLLGLSIIMRSIVLWVFYILLIGSYLFWSVVKNYKYVKNPKAFFILPMLQITSDIAVLAGSSTGLLKLFSLKGWIKAALNNKGVILIIIGYVILTLSVINWGIPGVSHPFTYHMDEWHFSQALRTFVKYGTGSYSGAASIPLYHIISTYIFLAPFFILHIFNPFLIKSSLENLSLQTTFFQILRLHTLFYGVLSTGMMYLILKRFIKFKPLIFTTLFVFTPIWIVLSNYYKYDITLNFWIITTIYYLFKFYDSHKFSNYIFAGVSCALALSTKFTAAPLFAMYIFSYFLFSDKIKFKDLIISSVMVLFIFSLAGIPDMLLLKGNYYELLNATLIRGPKDTTNYILQTFSQFFLLFEEFPQIFGYFLTIFSYGAVIYWFYVLIKEFFNKKLFNYKLEIFLIVSLIAYLIPTISFGVDAGGNRSLVMLPFMILILSLFFKNIVKRNKSYNKFIIIIVILGIFLQLSQSLSWQSVKLLQDPRVKSSEWIARNIPKGATIGVENIPIYQFLPNLVLKEFYEKQYGLKGNYLYNYQVISAADNKLPKYIIISNADVESKYLKSSPKIDILKDISQKNYIKIAEFNSDFKFYKIFGNDLSYFISGILPSVSSISVYEKL